MGYLMVVRRHATLIAVIAILTGLAAGLLSSLQSNRYTSSAYVRLDNAASPFRSTAGTRADLTRAMRTQMDLVTSDEVRRAVTERLGRAPHVVVAPRSQSDELAIRATASSPREAAAIASAYATAYIDNVAAENADANRSAGAARDKATARIQASIEKVENDLQTATGSTAQQLRLRRDVLTTQLKAIAVQDVTTPTSGVLSATLLSAAKPPSGASEPRPVRNGLLGFVAGLVLGFLAAALLEVIRDKVLDKQDIRMIDPQWPALGPVPLASTGHARTRDRSEALAFRGLRAELPAVLPHGYPATVLVTGPRGGEGTSTVVAGLARSLAQAGRSVAVIDANTMAPRQQALLGSAKTPALAQLLRGSSGSDRLLTMTDGLRGSLTIVPGSRTEDVDMLASPEFAALVDRLADSCEVVLIDAAPVLTCAETLNISQLVDVTLLVAAEDITRRSDVQSAATRIREANGFCAGVVLTDGRPSTPAHAVPVPIGPAASSLPHERVDPLAPAR